MARAQRQGGRSDTIALAVCVVLALLLRAASDPVREPIARALRQTVLAPLLHLQQSAERARHAWRSFESTSAARDTLALRLMETRAVLRENERLRSLIGLGARVREGFVLAEALHVQPIGEEFTITLTAGSQSGVIERAPVVAADGLVGMVRTVDPTISLAILTTHPKFAASARSVDSTAFGIVSPYLGSEPERNLLEMRNVGYRNQLPNGTLVVTSGIGGVYPEGIPIGTVIGELPSPEGWSRTYIVRPTVRPSDVGTVMILLPPTSADAMASVWSEAPGVETARRRVVTAGDSARARLDAALAAATAAARAAVLDSVAAASPGSVPRSMIPPARSPVAGADSGMGARQGPPPPTVPPPGGHP